ncbi:MAG: hypothetical protein COC15_02775 [Legionellales bacterium]|nr:MAG: hypothetical protein COC15_02775 [Legionellales bacterium]
MTKVPNLQMQKTASNKVEVKKIAIVSAQLLFNAVELQHRITDKQLQFTVALKEIDQLRQLLTDSNPGEKQENLVKQLSSLMVKFSKEFSQQKKNKNVLLTQATKLETDLKNAAANKLLCDFDDTKRFAKSLLNSRTTLEDAMQIFKAIQADIIILQGSSTTLAKSVRAEKAKKFITGLVPGVKKLNDGCAHCANELGNNKTLIKNKGTLMLFESMKLLRQRVNAVLAFAPKKAPDHNIKIELDPSS